MSLSNVLIRLSTSRRAYQGAVLSCMPVGSCWNVSFEFPTGAATTSLQQQRHNSKTATLLRNNRFSVSSRITSSTSNSFDIATLQHRPAYVTCNRAYTSSAVVCKEYPPHTLYPMPALSPTMDVGTIAEWYIKEGDDFTAGTALCSIETDKASVDFEAQDDGTLAKILRQGPSAIDIKIGTPICVIVDDKTDAPAFTDYKVDADISSDTAVSTSSTPSPGSPSAVSTTTTTAFPSGTSILFPSARHLAESNGLDATVLQGTGKGGRVTKGDVLDAMAQGTLASLSTTIVTAAPAVSPPAVAATAAALVATTAASAPATAGTTSKDMVVPVETIKGNDIYEEVPNNKMRKIIAARLTESKRDVPHFYTSMEVELDNILKLRKKLATGHDVKVSVNDFIIRCSALALRDVPEVNASYNVKTNSIQLNSTIDISVAVATPTGLITPIVFAADTLGLSDISAKVLDLAGRARVGKLAPHEYQGGSFSVSNLGMFGISEFSAVINPPQAAILAVGGGTRTVVATPYDEKKSSSEQNPPSIKTIMTARLSADRRVVDEATAALFVAALRQYLNQPELLLL